MADVLRTPDVRFAGLPGRTCAARYAQRLGPGLRRQHWQDSSFMTVGVQDPVLGRSAMLARQQQICGCPAPLQMPEGGHFVQEWGRPTAQAALRHFGLCAL